MNNVIDLSKYRINKLAQSEDSIETRMKRIKASLENINKIMSDLKESPKVFPENADKEYNNDK